MISRFHVISIFIMYLMCFTLFRRCKIKKRRREVPAFFAIARIEAQHPLELEEQDDRSEILGGRTDSDAGCSGEGITEAA